MNGEWSGEDIKRERLRADLSYRKLADRIGVSAAAVSQWESGATKPTAGHLKRLMEVLVDGSGDDHSEDTVDELLDEVRALLRRAETYDERLAQVEQAAERATVGAAQVVEDLARILSMVERIHDYVARREASLGRDRDD